MAFKTVKSYNEEKFGDFFLLRNDKDSADVIFLYEGAEDVLVADVHYLKSSSYSGYAHCCGAGCPACERGIRTQTKLFIPLYNLTTGKIEFFDRTMRFEPQLQQDVFSRYPNPSEYVFRIVRNGAAGSVDTTYSIVAVGKNTQFPYSAILAANNATMPEYYNNICRDLTVAEMRQMLNDSDRPSGYSPNEEYTGFGAVPRGTAAVPATEYPQAPEVEVPSGFAEPPQYVADATSGDSDDLGEPEF